jgi:hypothetical protein
LTNFAESGYKEAHLMRKTLILHIKTFDSKWVLRSLVRLGFASDKPDVVEGAGAKHFRVDGGVGVAN